MPGTTTPQDVSSHLTLKRAIDAACDRFEAAWNGGQNPSIEDYLEPFASGERPLLFRELLAAELSLRGSSDREGVADEFCRRFPQYRQIIAEVCAGLSVARTTTIRPSRDSTGQVPGAMSPPGDVLWDLMARRAGVVVAPNAALANSVEARRLDEVAEQLFEAFPPTRRPLLQSLLLGAPLREAAQRHGVTERTVAATFEAAVALLSGE